MRDRHGVRDGIVNPAHLDLFLAVLRHGGMTRAAAALGLGQPHVSRVALKELIGVVWSPYSMLQSCCSCRLAELSAGDS